MKKNKIIPKPSEKSLLGKLIDIYAEQARAKKAVRELSKQTWSLEFLEYLCVKCARSENRPVQILIHSSNGHTIEIKSQNISNQIVRDEDILDNLDNITAVNDFIRRHSK